MPRPIDEKFQKRFHIFQQEIQKRIQNGVVLGSVPCGLMEDLMTLNFHLIKDIELIGFDLDNNSLEKAQDLLSLLKKEHRMPFCASKVSESRCLEFRS